MKKRLSICVLGLAGALLVPFAKADTFLQYSTTSSTNSVSFDGTTFTGTNIPVNLAILDPAAGVPATGTLNFSATATGTASELFGFYYVQPVDNISFELTNGTSNILSGTAATGYLEGTDAGLELVADSTDGLVFTSDFYGQISSPSIQFGTGTADLSINGAALSNFDTTAGPGSFTGTAAATPEPSAMTLLGTGLLGIAGVVRRKLTA